MEGEEVKVPLRLAAAIVACSVLSTPASALRGEQVGRGRLPDDGTRRDCIPFDPSVLKVTAVPNLNSWLLSSGRDRMAMFDNEPDAMNAMALARRYREQCFIGRHASTRPGAARRPAPNYLIKFWESPTGVATTIAPESCTPYDPAQLKIEDRGAAGWLVTDGGKLSLPVDNQSDATAALALARAHTARCTIGRDDPRPPAMNYAPHSRVDYWK